jgi:hypothetical protein
MFVCNRNKSILGVKALRQSHESALRIQSSFVYSNQHQYSPTRSVLFAFSSTLKCKSECKRYQELYKKENGYLSAAQSGTPYSPPIRALCVVGREYGHEDNGKWTGIRSDNAGNEVLVFMGGIINKSRCIAKTRRPIRMEDYLFVKNTVFQDLAS